MAANMTPCPVCRKSLAIADLPDHLERVHQRHALAEQVRKLHGLPKPGHMSVEGQVAPHNDENEAMMAANSAAPRPTIDTMECPHCGMVVVKKRFAAHRRLHYPKPVKPQAPVKGSKKPQIGGVVFQSRTRGTRVTTPQQCNECGKVVTPTLRYPRSNRGPVHLCLSCRNQVFRRSFEDIDLMNTRLVVEHGRRDDEGHWDRDD